MGVLEATMIVVDNSEASRNGDYVPSRWEAQADAVNLIFHSKTQSNPESSVGLMSMGGSGPEVLTTLTINPGKVLDGLHRTKIGGQSHLYTGIMIASLALKHRQNKSQRQRIIVFTCSPISDSQQTLTKLARKMKKNNTSIDIISFGDLTDDTKDKLTAFNEAVKGGEGSHLEIVQPGPNLLSDSIVASPILAGEGGGVAAANGGGAGAGGEEFEFGIDPSADPELALALRMSLEEDRARQERERKAQEEAEGKTQLDSVAEGQEAREVFLMSGILAGACTDEAAFKVDYKKLAVYGSFKNANSAKASWHGLRKKLLKHVPQDANGDAAVEIGDVKRKRDAEEADEHATEAKKGRKTKKPAEVAEAAVEDDTADLEVKDDGETV